MDKKKQESETPKFCPMCGHESINTYKRIGAADLYRRIRGEIALVVGGKTGLVVEQTRIAGIVTWSDLLKVPVLVLAFSSWRS